MLVAAWYTTGALTYALNYGNSVFGDKENLGTSNDNKGGQQTQSAVGALYTVSKNLKARAVYRMQTIETDGNGVIAGTSQSNDSSAVILGVTASF